ncbi:MAG: hypothetical protein QW197_01520 [Candidatus Aenigmatarchaeota archaeon]
MKLQFSVYDALLASSILIIFYLVLYYSIPKPYGFEEKYIKFLSYDILFSLDKLYGINANYLNLRDQIYYILIDKVKRIPEFYISDYGLFPNLINISCICNEEVLRDLNNRFLNVYINGRPISIRFFPTTFPLTKTDFERHGLLIIGCENLDNYYADLLRYREVNGILFLCDINITFYNSNKNSLENVFSLTIGNNNGNSAATLTKPNSGTFATYKAFKILKYQFGYSGGQSFNLLTNSIVVMPKDPNNYLLRQANSDIAAATLTYYKNNIIGWATNFYRDNSLDSNEEKILLSLILSIASIKEPVIDEKFKDKIVPYISFHYSNFLEPFIIYFGIA